jgi:hypothetical protein
MLVCVTWGTKCEDMYVCCKKVNTVGSLVGMIVVNVRMCGYRTVQLAARY